MSTGGGVDYDTLCKGQVKNYSFNLTDISKSSFEGAKQLLIKKALDTISNIHIQDVTDRRVQKFVVGKTYVQRRKVRGGGYQDLDQQNYFTWKKKGIKNRWHFYSDQSFDGLIVLTCCTRDMLPEDSLANNWNHQHYALALESGLIQHFAFQQPDERLGNKSFDPGNLQSKLSAGYVVYMAYKLN